MPEIPHWMQDHIESDRRFQDASIERDDAMKKTLEEINEKLDPMLEIYRSVLLSKSFVAGLASIIVSITAIGVGVMWLFGHINNKP